uniref:DNA replication complex GINS protein PSF2 n=1 Tax=Eucampia antarctica TaxID=49252 RepID=A0A7S2SL96_9STRA|mmetsp:Transcript_9841/g.9509  ORF Transcript_9841/g.9509 Transcript_9841/m.9509 type:complete len:200 (+) Transcript_9841:1-600(+)
MDLISSTAIGPFTAGVDSIVPLWLAVLLRKRNLCRIVEPEWMNVANLKDVLTQERESLNFYDGLPFWYVEIARSILAVEDKTNIPQLDPIRILLEDIAAVRMDKIRSSIHTMSSTQFSSSNMPMDVITVNGIAAHEIQTTQPFLSKAFEHHLHLLQRPSQPQAPAPTNTTNTPTTTTTTNEPNAPPPSSRTSRIRRFRS